MSSGSGSSRVWRGRSIRAARSVVDQLVAVGEPVEAADRGGPPAQARRAQRPSARPGAGRRARRGSGSPARPSPASRERRPGRPRRRRGRCRTPGASPAQAALDPQVDEVARRSRRRSRAADVAVAPATGVDVPLRPGSPGGPSVASGHAGRPFDGLAPSRQAAARRGAARHRRWAAAPPSGPRSIPSPPSIRASSVHPLAADRAARPR